MFEEKKIEKYSKEFRNRTRNSRDPRSRIPAGTVCTCARTQNFFFKIIDGIDVKKNQSNHDPIDHKEVYADIVL